MKLIFCPKCTDVVRLFKELRFCKCKESSGRYLVDSVDAEIYGKAVPLGFINNSLAEALRNRPDDGMGKLFTAFVIPHECRTVKTCKQVT